ncbi:unnamed protein product [Bursaphelenchus xylophilus]|uniref:(pine wood nematode) hypothetical protein n=1 Tax=Bursaphelenchus xylophilus TaxID=6326 RepID=A0A1I7S1I1_BURXY|nr:unnamed protein product [Bursaphelenchus xylophilus]CAG9081460.1 unnamed protein product [Bursaphelenchus xylophilus]
MAECVDGIEGLSPNFHYFVSAGLGVIAISAACIAYSIQEVKRKKTFYGVEDKQEVEEIEKERRKSIKERTTEMKIVRSKEAIDNNEGVRVLVKAKKRSQQSLIRDYTPDWAATPLIHSYMRRSSPMSFAKSNAANIGGFSREIGVQSRIRSSENLKLAPSRSRGQISGGTKPQSRDRIAASRERPNSNERHSMKTKPILSISTTQAKSEDKDT